MARVDYGIYKHIESLLRQYPHIDKEIKEIIEDEQFTFRQENTDENIGGGHASNPQATENRLIGVLMLENQRAIRQLRNYQLQIKRSWDESDQETRDVIEAIYFQPHPNLSLLGIGQLLHMDKSKVSRLRRRFIACVGVKLGWIRE